MSTRSIRPRPHNTGINIRTVSSSHLCLNYPYISVRSGAPAKETPPRKKRREQQTVHYMGQHDIIHDPGAPTKHANCFQRNLSCSNASAALPYLRALKHHVPNPVPQKVHVAHNFVGADPRGLECPRRRIYRDRPPGRPQPPFAGNDRHGSSLPRCRLPRRRRVGTFSVGQR